MTHYNPPNWLETLLLRLAALLLIVVPLIMAYYLPHLIDLPPHLPSREINALAPSSF